LTKSGDIGARSCVRKCARAVLSLASDYRGQIQVGSLTGAVHLSKDNAGVLRPAQRERKSRVEHKGLSWLDPDFQYKYGRWKPGLSILLTLLSL